MAGGTTYYWQVRAKNASSTVTEADGGTWLSFITRTDKPAAPTGVKANAVSSSRIELSWQDNSDDESGFLIERSTDGLNWDQSIRVAADTQSYADTGVSPGTHYSYQVRAYRQSDNTYSEYSNQVSATTPLDKLVAPSDLMATAVSSSRIDLKWRDNSADESEFRIERSTDGSRYQEVGKPPADGESREDEGLRSATRYWYKIRAYRQSDGTFSEYASVASATTYADPLTPPSNLRITVTESSISLEWNSLSNASDFQVQRRDPNAFNWDDLGSVGGLVYVDRQLACDRTYQYHVRAHRDSDNQYSDYSPPATGTTPGCTPVAPSDLKARAASGSQIDLTWQYHSSDVATFYVERSLDGVSWLELPAFSAPMTAMQDKGLTCRTKYWYQVRAKLANGSYSAYSDTAFETTGTCSEFGKSAPSNGAIDQDTNLQLIWQSSPATDHYELCIDTIGNDKCDAVPITTPSTVYLARLSSKTIYYWQVRSFDASGASTDADGGKWWTFTTTADKPGAFGKKSPSDRLQGVPRAVALSWEPSSGATKYDYCVNATGAGSCNSWLPASGLGANVSGLSADTTYYWQVRALYADGSTEANGGNWWSFATLPEAPGAFGKSSPSDNAANQPTSPTLKWQASARAAGYELCVVTSRGNPCSNWRTIGNNTNASLIGLAAGTTHYWQVRSVNAAGAAEADQGTWWSFTTSTTPQTWVFKEEMKKPRYGLGAALGSNGRVYSVGGEPNNQAVEEFDPSTEHWTAKGILPTARHLLAATRGPDGLIYAIGGEAGGFPINAVESYDPVRTFGKQACHRCECRERTSA